MPMKLVEESDREALAEMYGVYGFSHRKISQALTTREPAKRKRTEGLNSRFDRMIETVNVVRDPDHEPRRKRRRTASSASGSSSLVGWAAPETSLDAYNDLDGGRLGEKFSTLQKSKEDANRDKRFLGEFPYQLPIIEPIPRNPEEDSHVPHWLSNTVSTLQAQHPLRGLIPAPLANPVQGQACLPQHIAAPTQSLEIVQQEPNREEDIFAFRPPTASLDFGNNPTRQPQPDPFQIPSVNSADAFGPRDSFEPAVPSSSRYAPPDQFQSIRPSPGLAERHSPDHISVLPSITSRQAATITPAYIDALPADLTVEHAPFSTPGPLARSANLQNSTSRFAPPPVASVSARILSVDDPVGPTDDPLPFSKPGPLAPAARIKDQPSFQGSLRSQNNNIPRFPKLFTPARALTPNSDSSEHFSLSDLLRSDSASSPTTNPLYPNTPCTGGIRRTSIAFRTPHLRSPSASSKDLLTTPGPTHIYFDSPTEDPQTSDPIDPTDYKLDLDYENLDFRWEKFDPSAPPPAGSRVTDRFPHISSDTSHDQDGESVENNQLPVKLLSRSGPTPQTPPRTNLLKRPVDDPGSTNQPRHEVSAKAPPISGQALSITNLAPHSDGSSEANQRISPSPDKDEPFNSPPAHKSPAAPEVAPGPAFAPALGIYISPLRSQVETVRSVKDDDGNESAEQDVGDRSCSGAGRKLTKSPVLPRTPPVADRTPKIPQLPKTPAPRRVQSSKPPTPPPMLDQSSSVETIEDSRPEGPSLSQGSHDTIESWSAA